MIMPRNVTYPFFFGFLSQTFSAIAEAVDENDDQLLAYSVERAIKQIHEAADKLKVH
jgi:hypothetical protein